MVLVMRYRGVAAALIAAVCMAGTGSSAHAAGMTTHAFMADKARSYLPPGPLRTLMTRQRGALLAGAAYPDGGYAVASVPGGAYGEETHWERFIDAFAQEIRGRPDCGDLTKANGRCAPLVAFLLGAAAHGLGDEMWDWLFEPNAADKGEVPASSITSSGLPGAEQLGALPVLGEANSIEFAMDMVAIVDHRRTLELPLSTPPIADLLKTYDAVGRPDITAQGITAGNAVVMAALTAERLLAHTTEYRRVKRTMPYTAAHMYDESGGVVDVAQGIAGYVTALWVKLTDPARRHPAPEVIAVHPEPNERGVPTVWPAGLTGPGPRGGGAPNRILAVLGNALPYRPLATSTTDVPAIPPAGFTLRERDSGVPVALLPGWPKAGPYGPDSGEHTMGIYPAQDLKPCTWYRVSVTSAVVDHAGVPVVPRTWDFQTRSATSPAPAGCQAGPDPGPGAGVANTPTLGPVLQPLLDLTPAAGVSPHHAGLAALGASLRK